MWKPSEQDRLRLDRVPLGLISHYNSPNIHNLIDNSDMEKIFRAMEGGHKVCKLSLLRRWDPVYKHLCFNRETRQLLLWQPVSGPKIPRPFIVDIRNLRDVQTLDYKLHCMHIGDKWLRDKEIRHFDALKIIVIVFGSNFILCSWILLFEMKEACQMWVFALNRLMYDTAMASHPLVIERWLRKEFYILAEPQEHRISTSFPAKLMKPFIQTRLQYRIQSNELQEITEEMITFEIFSDVYRRLIHVHSLFSDRFSIYSDNGSTVELNNFLLFLEIEQRDRLHTEREHVCEFLRKYFKDLDSTLDVSEPMFQVSEFCDYLFSRENSIWDPANDEVVHDMNRPLHHYWIASSHNTYLTGDQLKSDSSLDAYARALSMGCRCIELDCWDGQKRGPNDFAEIVIYHGYTMTSKLSLRDVLQTIREYAFVTSDYPVILSIEDNCSVPAQRLLASDLRGILGDLLLTSPVDRAETMLPSPAQLRRKIIVKHKKLPLESEYLPVRSPSTNDDLQEQDILSRECIKRGLLWMENSTTQEWSRHLFILLSNQLCYILEESCPSMDNDDVSLPLDDQNELQEGEEESNSSAVGFGIQPEEMHVTEEWFHGKIGRDEAKNRLVMHNDPSQPDGLFLIRESTTFIGDFSLSFIRKNEVHHCRIRTRMVDGEKRYLFLDTLQMATLYQLIGHYSTHCLNTPKFRTRLIAACPHPEPHNDQSWFTGSIDRKRAEELLNSVRQDGTFLIRNSSADSNVFVLSWRVDGENWHLRLKRTGRIFIVNQMVFETLNQIVDFFSSHELARGVCLKMPVNENTIGRHSLSELPSTMSGCYMELTDLEQEVRVRAIRANRPIATNRSQLSFPVGAIIAVVQKQSILWRGRYSSKTGWFPADCVVELDDKSLDENTYGTVELIGSLIEKFDTDRPFGFRISQAAQHWNVQECLLAANNSEDLADWLNTLHEVTRTANDKMHLLRVREKDLRIASELSNLVIYCQAVPFNPNFASENNFYEMCSFSETKHEKLVERGLIAFNKEQLSRVYPQARRLTSTNFNPVSMWNNGCQMVALNFQTGDKSMQLNQGKFMANGRSGFVLKPSYMLTDEYHPDMKEPVPNACPVTITIEVVAGRNLSRKDKNTGICSPFVEVEVVGLDIDCKSFRTRTIASDGLHPIWNEHFEFNVQFPEMALLRFNVEDGDFVGSKTDPFIGQSVYPIDCIRTGYRSVPLRNQFSEPLELSSLLVHCDIRTQNQELHFDGGSMLSLMHAGRSVNLTPLSQLKEPSIRNGSFLSLSSNLSNSPSLESGLPVLKKKSSLLKKISRLGKGKKQ